MASHDSLQIDLFAAARDGKKLTRQLSDAYFQELDQEEINGGQLHVAIAIKEGAGELFHVRYKVEGEVRVACDRCLEDLTIKVGLEDGFSISYADNAPMNDDVRYLEPQQSIYDFAWDIYEAVALSLPTQRVHAAGECAPEMLAHIQSETSERDLDARITH